MDNSILVGFGNPEHGWLPVDFSHREFQLEFSASDVLNNPIQELFDTLMELRANNAGQITWWLEPGAYFFHFEQKGTQYALTIAETDNLHNKSRETTIIKSISGNYKQIVIPFIKALIEFSSKTYGENHWPYRIDGLGIRQLKALL